MRRVVISGIGLVSPTGNATQVFWQSLLDGRSAIRRITRFDPTSYACQIGAEVTDRGYEELLDPRKLRTTTHVTQLGLAAAELALRDAGLAAKGCPPDTVGVVLGTALGGWREAEQQHSILIERGIRRVNPFIANGTPNHATAAEVATAVGAGGPHVTFSSGCPASTQAIGHAAALVASGDLEWCVAGGTESPLIPMVVAGMGRTQELSTSNDDPEHASRPFDRAHNGLVLGEGSCVFILEAAERALRRGVQPYAEVRGAASSCDASGLYGVDPTGEPGAQAIHRALQRSDLTVADIDYVCAHANSSPTFDRKETLVINKAFGEWAARLPVSSIKGVIGHPFGAAGAFQVAAASLAIRHQLIPPTHNLEVPDPECNLDCVPRDPRPARVRNVLVTSYGYGGLNTYLVLAEPRL
ncbi:MAG TPA: beta-ketoacyl-[acyl-carrier-protein] synthase family protein [Candidatus Margulisiibacteriota bacterium]|nr:beta-ketoacyl-[acyl-carrier-protein] synthase family protein [Candidatus Margulisiibacteriota bacterium]